ncbi:MAG TPA: PDZ domain-containing protein [Candidatus Eisenbacteria bacterium]|nr:PDZ domain-containing protein [Candidatus Eisenbacteria bacterium]
MILGAAPVVSGATEAPDSTGGDGIDALLAHALVTQLDARAAFECTTSLLYTKRRTHDQGVPPYLDASAKELSADIERLKAARSDDPDREILRTRLLARLENHREAVGLATQAILAAAVAGGWTSGTNEVLNRSWTAYRAGPSVDTLEIRVFSESAAIRSALPRGALQVAGIVQDSSGYRLGCVPWASAPMRIAAVSKGSRAERLGLLAGDEIVSVHGGPVASIIDLKSNLVALAGKKVEIVVKRDGGQVVLHPKVPAGAASYAEVRRELEQQYQKLVEAYGLQDDKAIAGMFTEDFHIIFPNGQIMDAQEAEAFYGRSTQGVGPIEARYAIRGLTISENRLIAVAEVFQEFKWMRKEAGTTRTTSSRQLMRQTWSKTRQGWKLKSTDQIRDEK